jgi:hypothetical protein
MRFAMVMAVVVMAGCASDKLALAPPQGVDLSAHWKLNEADSDDPQRLLQSQLANATAAAGPGGSTGSGGRGGGQSSRGGGYAGGPMGPAMPSVLTLDEALRWPEKDLVIQQSGGTVTFSSGGSKRVCRPDVDRHRHRLSGNDASHGRGDVPPPVCGWDARTLVVQSGEPEDERPPFELRFSVSDDGQRLIEVVSFKGGRSSGFTASRVWERVPTPAAGGAAPGAPTPATLTNAPQ